MTCMPSENSYSVGVCCWLSRGVALRPCVDTRITMIWWTFTDCALVNKISRILVNRPLAREYGPVSCVKSRYFAFGAPNWHSVISVSYVARVGYDFAMQRGLFPRHVTACRVRDSDAGDIVEARRGHENEGSRNN